MTDSNKTKEQLLSELIDLRKKIVELKNVKNSIQSLEEKIKQSEEKRQSLFENTPVYLATLNLEGVITSCNDAWLKISGYTVEEIVGKHFSKLKFICIKNLPEYFKMFTALLSGKDIKPFTGNYFLKDGKMLYLRVHLGRIKEKGKTVGYNVMTINVTDLKKTEESLRKSQQEFAVIFRNSPEALIYIDEKSKVLNINSQFTKLFGYTLEDIKGRNVDNGMIHSQKMIYEGKKLTKKALKGFINYETIRKRKDGSEFSVFISSAPVKIDNKLKGTITLYQDITERKKAEEKLRQSEEKFAGIFKNIPSAAFYQNVSGVILDVNLRFTQLFGYTKEEIVNKNIDEIGFYPKGKIEEGKYFTRKILEENLINLEAVRQKKDGTLVPVRISTSLVKIKGKTTGIMALYQDITESKQNETIQKVLYNISKATNSSISLDQLYPIIHKELGNIIDTTNFYISLLDQRKDKIYFPYHVDEMEDDFEIQSINDRSLTCYVIKHKSSLLLNYDKIKKLQNRGELLNPGAITKNIFWFGVPLKVEDKVIGAMAVQSYNNPNNYSEKNTTLLEFVSSQVATAIDRKQTEEKIKHLSFHDSLTGLYNRAYFMEELERLNFPRYYPLSIVSIDINGLKFVNDTFGHSEGDKLLKHLAVILKSVSRKGDILARFGGDEFAITLPSTSFSQTHDFCGRLKKVCKDDSIEPTYLAPSISLGYATQDGDYRDIDSFLIESDNRMYQDKLFTAKNREKHLLDSILIILAERDPHTRNHAERLQNLALSLGRKIRLSDFQLNSLKLLALLHDIGKIGIPDSILFKTYMLTSSEWKKMKEHSKIGYRMARNFPDFSPIAREILYHHEKWDGSGYPEGLKGENIPLLSRIISIVDAYDVMQSRRPYKGAISKEEALKELNRCAGTQFDPNLVKIFIKSEKNGKEN